MRSSFARRLPFVLLLLIVPALTPAVAAATIPQTPDEHTWVIDLGNVTTGPQEDTLTIASQRVWEAVEAPIFVLTIESLAAQEADDLTLEQYARSVFNAWGIGERRQSYGVLLVISVGDREVWIELGEGWGSSMQRVAQGIIDETFVPRAAEGDLAGAVLATHAELATTVEDRRTPFQVSPLMVAAVLAVTIVFVASMFSVVGTGRGGWGWSMWAIIFLAMLLLLKASAKSAVSGGRGGGGAGGGW